jgi:hypothetical protein
MALSDQKQVEAFADNLTQCADSIHERLKKAIKSKEIDQYTAQSIFQDESILRQRANSLYIGAANHVVADLRDSQKDVTILIDTAKATIRTMDNIARFIDLIADLLVHDCGISIIGSYVFGMDTDFPDTFKRTVEFVTKS